MTPVEETYKYDHTNFTGIIPMLIFLSHFYQGSYSRKSHLIINHLSTSDVNSRHDDIVTSDGYRASYRENHQKWLKSFGMMRRFATKWYTTLYI